MDKVPITASGFALMEADLKNLKTVERPAIIQAISEARAHGDLSENAEYHAAKEKQSFIEGRIQDLEDRISRAEVIDVKTLSGDTVKFGATVVLLGDNEKKITYQIVGEYEADISSGKLSVAAPIARALIGKRKGDFVEVVTPSGSHGYEIISVAFK
jgi:transcription elongation factor GreA